MIGPTPTDETPSPPAARPARGAGPAPRCGTENVVRERPPLAGVATEVCCDYCGTVSEFVF